MEFPQRCQGANRRGLDIIARAALGNRLLANMQKARLNRRLPVCDFATCIRARRETRMDRTFHLLDRRLLLPTASSYWRWGRLDDLERTFHRNAPSPGEKFRAIPCKDERGGADGSRLQ